MAPATATERFGTTICCVRAARKRQAVVFVTRMEGDKTYNDGLCLVCAKELGIKPVSDMMENSASPRMMWSRWMNSWAI